MELDCSVKLKQGSERRERMRGCSEGMRDVREAAAGDARLRTVAELWTLRLCRPALPLPPPSVAGRYGQRQHSLCFGFLPPSPFMPGQWFLQPPTVQSVNGPLF